MLNHSILPAVSVSAFSGEVHATHTQPLLLSKLKHSGITTPFISPGECSKVWLRLRSTWMVFNTHLNQRMKQSLNPGSRTFGEETFYSDFCWLQNHCQCTHAQKTKFGPAVFLTTEWCKLRVRLSSVHYLSFSVAFRPEDEPLGHQGADGQCYFSYLVHRALFQHVGVKTAQTSFSKVSSISCFLFQATQ